MPSSSKNRNRSIWKKKSMERKGKTIQNMSHQISKVMGNGIMG
jgi:hypothetical protein